MRRRNTYSASVSAAGSAPAASVTAVATSRRSAAPIRYLGSRRSQNEYPMYRRRRTPKRSRKGNVIRAATGSRLQNDWPGTAPAGRRAPGQFRNLG